MSLFGLLGLLLVIVGVYFVIVGSLLAGAVAIILGLVLASGPLRL